MFGGGERLVVIDQADDFVSRYRAELERYAEHPKTSSVLVLDVASWPSNTRLYKALAGKGLVDRVQVSRSGPLAEMADRLDESSSTTRGWKPTPPKP